MCRGRKKALKSLIQDFRDSYSHDTSLPVGIISADAQKDANWLEAQIRKEKGCEGLTIIHSQVGPVIGAHVGPGMVGYCLLGELTAARSFRFLTELLTGFVNLINGYKVWGRSLERPQFVYLFQSERTHTWH